MWWTLEDPALLLSSRRGLDLRLYVVVYILLSATVQPLYICCTYYAYVYTYGVCMIVWYICRSRRCQETELPTPWRTDQGKCLDGRALTAKPGDKEIPVPWAKCLTILLKTCMFSLFFFSTCFQVSSMQSWVSTIQPVVLTADVFQYFIEKSLVQI